MIGLVLVTHGGLALEFKKAVEHVVGTQDVFETICMDADDDMEQCRQDIIDAVGRVRSDAGCVLITDMFGGTPSNLALSVSKDDDIEVLAGVNLPMLIKFARVRATKPLNEAVQLSAEAGRSYITIASEVMAS